MVVTCLGLAGPALAAGPLNGGPAPLPGSTFQGADGNETTPTAGDPDYAGLPERVDWQTFANDPSRLTTSPDPQLQDSEFITGSHESDPNDWDFGTNDGGVTPDKANVLGAWGITDPLSNNTFLYLAFRRASDGNGATFYHFELNQRSTTWTNASGETIPCREDGDVMVVYEIDGGLNVTISLLKWEHDQPGPAACPEGAHGQFTGGVVDKIDGQAVAQGAFNSGPITNYLDTNFDGDGIAATPASQPSGPATLPTGTFGEAALNLTSILGNLGDPCFNFGQIQMHSRSSPSFDSALQDFIAPRPIALRSCSISGTKYEDANANGQQDPGEGPLQGFRVYDDANHNDQYDADAGERSSITDTDGRWAVTGLAAGTHEIREDLSDQPGWQCTDPQPCELSVSLANGGNVDGLKFGNFKPAKIVIDKTTRPSGSAQPFAFTSDVPGHGSFMVSDDDATNEVMTGLAGGTYHVTESATAGWALTDIACDDPTSNSSGAGATATIALAAGETVTCHFTNKRDAHVTIVKDAVPNSAQDFSFITSGLGDGFKLDDDNDPTLSNTEQLTVSGNDFGQKTVTEAAQQGWSLTNLVCTGDAGASTSVGDRTATLDVDPGEDMTCTFTNKKAATVTIVKDAVPDSAQDFSFTTNGLGDGFDLDDDNDPTLDRAKTIIVEGSDLGTKSVTEAQTDGWDLTGLECADGNTPVAGAASGRTATLDVKPGGSYTCTYTNTKRGEVSVAKTEGTSTGALTRSWTFRLTGGPDEVDVAKQATPDNQGSLEFGDLRPGDYSLCEEGIPAGWYSTLENDPDAKVTDHEDGTKDVCVTFTVDPGEDQHFDVINRRPQNLVVKEGNVQVHHGDTLTFTFDVTNVGNAPLRNVTVHDDHCPDADISSTIDKGDDETPDTLDTGDHWIYTCTMPVPEHSADEEDPIHNTVTATATDEDGHEVSASDDHTTDILHPAIELDKKVRVGATAQYVDGPVEAYVGDTLGYQVTVKNTGDTALTLKWGEDAASAAFDDERCDVGTISGPAGDDANGRLDAGETWTFTCSHHVTAQDPDPLKNTVKVIGTDSLGGEKGTVTDQDSTVTDVLHPGIGIDKTGPPTATAGDLVTYTLDVTNPGDVAFAEQLVVVTDALCQAPPALQSKNGDGSPATLDTGERWTYTCQVQTAAGQTRVDNVAQATGTDHNGHSASAQDDAVTQLVQPPVATPTPRQSPQIQVSPARVRPGSARLRGPTGCPRTKVVKATVTGRLIVKVTFYLDGKRVRTLTKPDKHGRWILTVTVGKVAYGTHRVVARVQFAKTSETKAKTMRLSFNRCRPAIVAPKFTG